MEEKRKYYRAKTINLISYECIGKDGFPSSRGMGKILDISKGGLLMETKAPTEAKYILIVSLDDSEKQVKIKGEIAYCRESAPKVFHTGIRFIETNEKIREVVIAMIKAFIKTKTA